MQDAEDSEDEWEDTWWPWWPCRQFSSAESTAKAEPGEETEVFRRGDGLMDCQKKEQPIDLNILKSYVRSWLQWIQKHVGVVKLHIAV